MKELWFEQIEARLRLFDIRKLLVTILALRGSEKVLEVFNELLTPYMEDSRTQAADEGIAEELKRLDQLLDQPIKIRADEQEGTATFDNTLSLMKEKLDG